MIYITLGIQHDMDILEAFKRSHPPCETHFFPFLMVWNPEIKILEGCAMAEAVSCGAVTSQVHVKF